MNSQYKKGVVELCVLSLLEKGDCYGYEISETLSRHIDIADGTVYQVLRKYYQLTQLGRETYQADREEYLKFAREVRTLLEGEEK